MLSLHSVCTRHYSFVYEGINTHLNHKFCVRLPVTKEKWSTDTVLCIDLVTQQRPYFTKTNEFTDVETSKFEHI